MGDENPIHTLGDYFRPSHEGYRNTIELPKGNNVVPLRSDTIRAIALPQDVPSTFDRRLIELENQVQRLIGPHDTQNYMETLDQAFVNYTSSHINEIESKRFTSNQGPRSFNDAANTWKEKPNLNWAHTQTFTNLQGGNEEIKEKSKEEDGMETDIEVEEVIEEEESEFETDEEVEETFDEEEEDEDTSSIIDRHLGEMVFKKPFIDETGLFYNKENRIVMFKQGDEKVTFKMPYTMKIFKQTQLMGFSTDSIPPFAYEENFGHGKTHYY
nr:MAK10-like protein [Tanacetum cinerariifolium]